MINVCLINKMELVDEVVGNLSTGIKKTTNDNRNEEN